MFGKEFQMDSLVYKKKQLVLNHNQNFLTFEFAALDFSAPAKNRYAYMLKGLDKNWNYTDANNRRAQYTALPPGHYTLVIKGSNNEGVWNEQGTTMEITIKPPWYKTLVAYIGYVILAVLGLYLYIKIRERKLIHEKRVLEQKVKERTAQIEQQKEEITSQRDQIAEQNKSITDSIVYAEKIQSAVLPPERLLQETFPDSFIYFKPRDIVSGDFYWINEKGNQLVVVAADCTGHGVPGAFMSMLGVAFLTEIVNKMEDLHANLILDQLRDQVIKMLHQKSGERKSKDGMDIALCIFDKDRKKMQFAGAFNPMYILRNGEIEQIKGDRMPIAQYVKEKPFEMHELEIQKGDIYYIFSDGYADQFSEDTGQKFKYKQLRELLVSIQNEPMPKQREILDNRFQKWKGNIDQIDDVLVMGIKC